MQNDIKARNFKNIMKQDKSKDDIEKFMTKKLRDHWKFPVNIHMRKSSCNNRKYGIENKNITKSYLSIVYNIYCRRRNLH